MTSQIYHFGEFKLDPAARELHHVDVLVALPPKSFDCLAYLIAHRDRAVGRDELISAVWGRVDVNDALLAQTLLRARRAVGDTGSSQSAIRTVPRFGYRWIAALEAVANRELLTPTAASVTAATVMAPVARSTAPGALGQNRSGVADRYGLSPRSSRCSSLQAWPSR